MIYKADIRVLKRNVAKELRIHAFGDELLGNIYRSAYTQGWRDAEAFYTDVQNRAQLIVAQLEGNK